MKRVDDLFEGICSPDNLRLADTIARKGKRKQRSIRQHDRNRDANIQALHELLNSEDFHTSEYDTFTIHEPKERLIFRLPYYPDRIVHHAIMNKLEPMFLAYYTADTYSCIKRRGTLKASKALRKMLKDVPGTQYCLKLDITKFYPSVDHDILKGQLRRKIKDDRLLRLLDGIIDSAPGLPIGNYLSQHLANFYLTGLDHFIKEVLKVKYLRYADDIVIPCRSKKRLHEVLARIREYLQCNLKLSIKPNYQIFRVAAHPGAPGRGIDFVGYVHYHDCVLLRKGIKKSMCRMYRRRRNKQSMAAYNGWAKHCNSINLMRKLNYGTTHTTKEVQRHGHSPGSKTVQRKEDRGSRHNRSKDRSAGIQNRAIEI